MGRSFGLPFKRYENNFIKNSLGRTIKYDEPFTPGPGNYNYQTEIVKDRKKITISNKFEDIDLDSFKLAPNTYRPDYNIN